MVVFKCVWIQFSNLTAAMWLSRFTRAFRTVTSMSPQNVFCRGIETTYVKVDGTIGKRRDVDIINDIIDSEDDFNQTDWKKLRQTIISSSRQVNDSNVDSFILMHFGNKQLFDSAKHFINYMKLNNDKLNLGAVGTLFKLYYQRYQHDCVTEADKSHILEVYRDLISKYPLLNLSTLEYSIRVLSITSEWRECLVLLEKLKLYSSPSLTSYCAVISACMKNNEPEIGWNLIKEIVNSDTAPYSTVYDSLVDFYVNKFQGNSEEMLSAIEKTLQYTSDNFLLIDEHAANKFSDFFTTQLGWEGDSVLFNKSGRCPNCKTVLKESSVTSAEHELLKKAFYDQVIIGQNVFIKSSPKEVEEFLDFIKKTAPFDIVIDGLNVAYSGAKIKTPQIISNTLVAVVKHYLEYGLQKILVLGRKHMNTWPKKNMQFLSKNSYLYLVDDSSYDDTFLLYAALCAEHTDFVSRDLMRGHKFMLENEKIIFKQWQEIHQHSLAYVDFSGGAKMNPPVKWMQYAQKNVNWHIPYHKENETLGVLEFPRFWKCIKPNRK